VVTITAALADNPIAGVNASVSMITKGGLNTVTRSLAIEYAKEGIRFNRGAAEAVQTGNLIFENFSRMNRNLLEDPWRRPE
jgi:NAD(P)-dependent dehydrogenase (short-subunit alcohol dehydrogenase family)